MLGAIERLDSKHVGLYLLRAAANVSKVLYITRTTQKDMIEGFLDGFDTSLTHAVQEVIGLSLDEKQHKQIELRVADSGLGLRMSRSIADVAYVSSRAKTFEPCLAMDGEHVWEEAGVESEDVAMGGGQADARALGLLGAVARLKRITREYREGGLDAPGRVPKHRN